MNEIEYFVSIVDMIRFVAMATFTKMLQSFERHNGSGIYCCGNLFHVVITVRWFSFIALICLVAVKCSREA